MNEIFFADNLPPTFGEAQPNMGAASNTTNTSRRRARVVIVGAGFAGIETAKALRHAQVDITLIDRRNHHLFQPLLYQVATASLSPGDITWPIRSIFRDQPNVTVQLADVSGVDTGERIVTDGLRRWSYDYLVIATGVGHSYFGRDDWANHAPGLKTVEDATELRRRLLLAFERAELCEDPRERQALMRIAVIGGGPTGVELAGAIAELAHRTLPKEFRNIDPTKAEILLIEAGPRLLPAFPERLSAVAQESLKSMRVTVRTGATVTSCSEKGVIIAGHEKIEAATLVWAAGVKASPAASWLNAPQDRAGRVAVCSDLSVPGFPEIFVIGDTATTKDDNGGLVPGVAPAAKQMGRHVGSLIANRVAGVAGESRFRYKHTGDLATIGRKSAVVRIGGLALTGFAGWLFWCIAHVWFLIGFRSRIVVTFDWIWSYLTAHRGARLIAERGSGNKAPG